jgi:DNA-binding transcriptional regulator YdaS (Cro superfamily)
MQSQTLAAWIDARMSRAAFARLVGMSPSHLSLVISGGRGVSLRQAVAIESATEGAITTAALLRQRFLGSGERRLGNASQ